MKIHIGWMVAAIAVLAGMGMQAEDEDLVWEYGCITVEYGSVGFSIKFDEGNIPSHMGSYSSIEMLSVITGWEGVRDSMRLNWEGPHTDRLVKTYGSVIENRREFISKRPDSSDNPSSSEILNGWSQKYISVPTGSWHGEMNGTLAGARLARIIDDVESLYLDIASDQGWIVFQVDNSASASWRASEPLTEGEVQTEIWMHEIAPKTQRFHLRRRIK